MRSTTNKFRGKKKKRVDEDLADGYYLVHVANSSQVPSSLGILRGSAANAAMPLSGGLPSQAPAVMSNFSVSQKSNARKASSKYLETEAKA